MPYFISIDATGNIIDLFHSVNGNVPVDGIEVSDAQGDVLRGGFSGFRYVSGELVVRIDIALKRAIAKTYTDVDAIYAAAIGNRKTEYEEAEQAALAFQAAGYSGTASPFVADYATAAGITDRQSTDLIIARAASLRAAVLAMRSTRFTSQAAMRAATTQAELDAAVAAWDTFIAQVRASLGA